MKEVFAEDRDKNDKAEIWERRKGGNEKTNGGMGRMDELEKRENRRGDRDRERD